MATSRPLPMRARSPAAPSGAAAVTGLALLLDLGPKDVTERRPVVPGGLAIGLEVLVVLVLLYRLDRESNLSVRFLELDDLHRMRIAHAEVLFRLFDVLLVELRDVNESFDSFVDLGE